METVVCGRCKRERELKKFRPEELKRGGAGCWCNSCLLKYHQKWKKGYKNVNSARCKKCGLDKPIDRQPEGSKRSKHVGRYWCADCKKETEQHILYNSVAKGHHHLPLFFRHKLAETLSKYEVFSVDDKGFVQGVCCHCNKVYNVVVGAAISRIKKYEQNNLLEQGKLNEQTFCNKKCRLDFETAKTYRAKVKEQHQYKIKELPKQRQRLIIPEIIIKNNFSDKSFTL